MAAEAEASREAKAKVRFQSAFFFLEIVMNKKSAMKILFQNVSSY